VTIKSYYSKLDDYNLHMILKWNLNALKFALVSTGTHASTSLDMSTLISWNLPFTIGRNIRCHVLVSTLKAAARKYNTSSDLPHSDKPTIPILTMKFAIVPILSILVLCPILAIGCPLPANALVKRKAMNVESRESKCLYGGAICMKA